MTATTAPLTQGRRYEALLFVGADLFAAPEAATAVTESLEAGVVVGVVGPGPAEARGADPSPGGRDRSALLLASMDGPERAVVEDGAVHRSPVRVPDTVEAALDQARDLVLDGLTSLGLPAVRAPDQDQPRRGMARIVLQAPESDVADDAHVRHVLAGAGLSGRVALLERVAGLARTAFAGVRVRLDGHRVVLAVTDASDAVRWTLDELWRRGIGAADVVVVTDGPIGDEDSAMRVLLGGCPARTVAAPAGDGSRAFLAALAEQVGHRRAARLPSLHPEPGWGLVVEGFDREQERARSALVALADGRVGIGGAPVADHPDTHPWSMVSGVYDGDGPASHLLRGPVATRLACRLDPEDGLRRTLDLHSGVLQERVVTDGGSVSSVRFASLARPGTVVLRVGCPVLPGSSLLAPGEDAAVEEGEEDTTSWMRVPASTGGIVAAMAQSVVAHDGGFVVDRIASYHGDADALPEPAVAVHGAGEASSRGFDRLLEEHRGAWAGRWDDADVAIDGDDDLQVAVRFALFHLMGSVADEGEAAVGARGLTGPGYRGHVFWDADTFVLPFLAATRPAAARAMLEYRIRRLDAALDIARSWGRRGARFPWESARSGHDVTPTSARDRTGQLVPIRTGLLQEHIVAEVAWAARCYIDWTGDQAFARGPGLRLLVETARYWSSRVRIDAGGGAHVYGVIGPDEYHEPVDDNAFTNVMVRWNLRRAADAVDDAGVGDHGVTPEETLAWRRLGDALVDGYDPSTGIYEQFAGFFDLEPLFIAEVAPRRPIAADLLLGRERVQGAQVLKQADVLMLHHLVPDEVAPGSLEPNLRYYEPRTAHGSSLSPAVHASLFARVRDYDRAVPALQMSSRIDLDDLTSTTAGGLHTATMGGLWQALAFGFAGLRPRDRWLHVDPRLPTSWAGLNMTVRFRGSRVRVRIAHDHLHLEAEHPVGIAVDGAPFTLDADGLEFRRQGPRWEPVP